jgi:hypothetical protein
MSRVSGKEPSKSYARIAINCYKKIEINIPEYIISTNNNKLLPNAL